MTPPLPVNWMLKQIWPLWLLFALIAAIIVLTAISDDEPEPAMCLCPCEPTSTD